MSSLQDIGLVASGASMFIVLYRMVRAGQFGPIVGNDDPLPFWVFALFFAALGTGCIASAVQSLSA
ncbi:MAG: hypothetical protein AAGK17_13750 [Pseudomonadota bacterium]